MLIGMKKNRKVIQYHTHNKAKSSVRNISNSEGTLITDPQSQQEIENGGDDSPMKMPGCSSYLLGVKFVNWYRVGCKNIK